MDTGITKRDLRYYRALGWATNPLLVIDWKATVLKVEKIHNDIAVACKLAAAAFEAFGDALSSIEMPGK